MAFKKTLTNPDDPYLHSNEEGRIEYLHRRLAAGASQSEMSVYFRVPFANVQAVTKRTKKEYANYYK